MACIKCGKTEKDSFFEEEEYICIQCANEKLYAGAKSFSQLQKENPQWYGPEITNKDFERLVACRQNEWIDRWLKKENIQVEMYNFERDTESSVGYIQALKRIFGRRGKWNLSIPSLGVSEYNETVQLGLSEQIFKKIKEFENGRK